MVWQLVQSWPSITVAVLVVYWLAMAIIVITDEREPTETLAWLLVLFAFPLLGLLFYFLFGRNWKKIAAAQRLGKEIFALALPTMNRVWGKYARCRAGRCSSGRRPWASRRSSRRRSPPTPPTSSPPTT